MSVFFTMISLMAILTFSWFSSVKFKISSAITPFISLSIAMIYFSALGCFNILTLGGYIYFILSFFMAIYLLTKKRDTFREMLTPGFIFFFFSSVLIILYFSYKQPLFMLWDEFSFWGTSAKLVKINNQLYTTAQIGWDWAATQKPGLIMIGYFFEFFGSHHEWRVAAGVDILLFSTIAAIGAVFTKKRWQSFVPFAFLGFLIPYIYTLYAPIVEPSSVYMSIMADIPMGMIFGAVFCVYYTTRGSVRYNLPTAIALFALTFIKDTAFPMAMVAAGIMLVDTLLLKENNSYFSKKQIKEKSINAVLVFITPIIAFTLWVLYQSSLGVNTVGDIGGSEAIGMGEMLLLGVQQLLGIGRSEKFSLIMGNMLQYFFTVKLSILGNGFTIFIIILIILAVAFITSNENQHKVSVAIYTLLSSLGFVAYYLFIGFCYVFIFKDIESSIMIGYERYIYPYYMGWFIGAILLATIPIERKSKHFFGLSRLMVVGIIAISCLRLSNVVTVGKSFLDFQDGYLDERLSQIEKTKDIVEYIGEDNRENIFFIGQGDDGGRWFEYSCELLPLQLEYSYGGGTLCLPQDVSEGTYYHIRTTPEELLEYIKTNKCKYIFVEKSDGFLKDGFGQLFNDGLASCEGQGSALYKVENDSFILVGEVS